MGAAEILVMRGISKEFPGVKALKEVTFSVRQGEIHALCGENGAGKSTCLRAISRLVKVQTGRILFALDALDRRKPQERGRRFRIGSRQDLPADGRNDY